jgi:hypothetical protein
MTLGRILLAALAIGLLAAPALADPTVTGDQAAWADLKASWVKLHGLSAYRAKISTDGGMSGVMEFVAPNSYHMTMQAQGGAMEMINVNGKTAFKMNIPGAPAGWQCRDVKPPANVPDLQNVEGTINVTRQPDTTINETPVHVYVTSMTSPSSPAPVEGTWYVGSATGLPVRFASDSGGHKTTMDFYDYGANITVSLPACG